MELYFRKMVEMPSFLKFNISETLYKYFLNKQTVLSIYQTGGKQGEK